METRILKQVKVFDIKALGETLFGHGYSDTVPDMVWAEEQIWESEEKCQSLLKGAILEWQKQKKKHPWATPSEEPKLIVYWRTTEIINNQGLTKPHPYGIMNVSNERKR